MNAADYLIFPLSLMGIIGIEALGLQIIVGGAGLLTLGHSSFFAIGAYASSLMAIALGSYCVWPWNGPILALCALFGALMAMLAAVLVALPCLRLRGDYLAVATLGFGQIIQVILLNVPQWGGASGLTQIPQILSPFQTLAVVGLGVCLSLGCLWRFYQTGLGLAVVCAREDEIVAHCFGISSFRARLAAFALGNGFAGLAGALAAQLFVFVSPKAASFEKSVEILLGLILGGIHNLWGGVCGAICLVALPEILRFLPGLLSHVGTADLSPLSQLLTHLSQNTMLLFAVGVVLHLRFGQQLGSRLGRKRKPI